MAQSLIINGINKLFEYSQNKCSYLWENSFFLQKIDCLILTTILGVFVLSIFASSDLIGYVALVTLFLTVIKLLLKKGEKIEPNTFEIFLIFYFLTVLISLAGSTLFYLSFKGFLKTFTYLGFYFSLVQYYKNNLNKIPMTLLTIALCAASQGLVGIVQNFWQVGEISTWQDVSNINPEDVMTRVYGTLQPFNPNLFGGYMVGAIPALIGALTLSLFDKKYKTAAALTFFAAITSIALILSGCRGAYIGFLTIAISIFALLAKFIWESGKEVFKRIYLSVLGALIAFSATIILFVSSVRTRVFSIFAMRQDSSTSFRFNVYQSAFNMLNDNWLFGIGIGNQNFREIYGLYMKTGFDALSCYSVFLEIAVESGIFALLAFLGFLLALAYKSVRFIFESKEPKTTVIVATALVSIIAVMVHGLVDTIFFRPQVQFIFWAMVAFISANLRLNPENNKRG